MVEKVPAKAVLIKEKVEIKPISPKISPAKWQFVDVDKIQSGLKTFICPKGTVGTNGKCKVLIYYNRVIDPRIDPRFTTGISHMIIYERIDTKSKESSVFKIVLHEQGKEIVKISEEILVEGLGI